MKTSYKPPKELSSQTEEEQWMLKEKWISMSWAITWSSLRGVCWLPGETASSRSHRIYAIRTGQTNNSCLWITSWTSCPSCYLCTWAWNFGIKCRQQLFTRPMLGDIFIVWRLYLIAERGLWWKTIIEEIFTQCSLSRYRKCATPERLNCFHRRDFGYRRWMLYNLYL